MVRRTSFLIDTSALPRLQLPEVAARWADELSAGRVGICASAEIETLCSARSVGDFERKRQVQGDLFTRWPMPESVWSDAQELQEQLLEAGAHRSAGLADLLLAATARHHGLTVLHYDRDFETIGHVTGQPTCWLAEPGSIP
jgi:predicted nucleic acid-binding protein